MEPIEKQSDEELVLAFKNGDPAAFEALVYRYKNPLLQYIGGWVKDTAAAEDLFQEVFVSFFKQIGRFEVRGKFKSWLFLAARNRVFNFFRDRKIPVSLDETDEDGNAFWQERLAAPEQGPLEKLAGAEDAQHLRSLVEKLPPRQREVIYLRAHFSFKEMAQLLHRPLGTVLADCHRGVQKIQQFLAAQAAAEEL